MIQRLFEQALEAPAGERERLLRSQGADEQVIAEVLRLLAAHERVEREQTQWRNLIGRAAGNCLGADDDTTSLIGHTIDKYRIEAVLGQGGMGRVFRAARCDGQLQQTVAIKLLHASFAAAGFDLLREAQHLADLHHPHIAQLLTAGRTANGVPYLVMEYIVGHPIDQYCTQQALLPRERLRLLAQLCLAVHHAHQHLVIHADLKPSNVYVNEFGQIKLMDFGIAHHLDTEHHSSVRSDAIAATPRYASPEQRRGETLTVASDIYAIGRLAQQLLPHPPPAMRAIIACCLREDAAQRYDSAATLHSDIQCVLNHRPSSLTGAAPLQRVQWWLRRHPALASLLASATLTAMVFVVIVTRNHRELAQAHQQSEQLSGFLTRLIEAGDPLDGAAEHMTVHQLIDNGARKINDELRDFPEQRLALLNTLATSLFNLGQFDDSLQLLDRAPADVSDPVQQRVRLLLRARILQALQRYDAALIDLTAAEPLTPEPDTVQQLEWAALRSELLLQNQQLEQAQFQVDAMLARFPLRASQTVAERLALSNLLRVAALCALATEHHDLSSAHLAAAMTLVSGTTTTELRQRVQLQKTAGLLSIRQQRWATARQQLSQAHLDAQQLYDRFHPDLAQLLRLRAEVEMAEQEFDAAFPLFQQAVGIYLNRFGDSSLPLADVYLQIAHAMQRRGDALRAKDYFGKAATIYRVYRHSHRETWLTAIREQSNCALILGRYREAIAINEDTLAVLPRTTAQDDAAARIRLRIAQAHLRQHDIENAGAQLDAARSTLTENDPQWRLLSADWHQQRGEHAAVVALLATAIANAEPSATWTIDSGALLARSQLALKDHVAARQTLTEVVARAERLLGELHPDSIARRDELLALLRTLNDRSAPALAARIAALQVRIEHPLVGYRERLRHEGGRGAIVFPLAGTEYHKGERAQVRWEAAQLPGQWVSLFVLHGHRTDVGEGGTANWPVLLAQTWHRFADRVPNTGAHEFDPVLMNANGTEDFKVLAVSDLGYWSLSTGLFSIFAGDHVDDGISETLLPDHIVDALPEPGRGTLLAWGEPVTLRWESARLPGRTLSMYIIHDNPTGIGDGVDADLALIQKRRWYRFAALVPNTGEYRLDPTQMEGYGINYKLLFVSDSGHWCVSPGKFTLVPRRSESAELQR